MAIPFGGNLAPAPLAPSDDELRRQAANGLRDIRIAWEGRNLDKIVSGSRNSAVVYPACPDCGYPLKPETACVICGTFEAEEPLTDEAVEVMYAEQSSKEKAA